MAKLINSHKIKVRMAEMNIRQKDIAEELNIAPPTVSLKLNNERPMSLEEAEKLSKFLKIKDKDFGSYFFA